MVLTALELGQRWMVLTDHSPRLRVANGLSPERLAQQIAVVDAIDGHLGETFTLLKGIEVDILDDGSLDQSDEMLDRLDFVTASVHSKLRMNTAPMTRRMVTAVSNPRVNVLGHCTGRLVTGSRGTRPQSEFDARAVFEACAEHGTAVEINSRPERCDPPDELVELAADIGCVFAIDSDAHAPGQLEMKAYGAERAERLGIDPTGSSRRGTSTACAPGWVPRSEPPSPGLSAAPTNDASSSGSHRLVTITSCGPRSSSAWASKPAARTSSRRERPITARTRP
jgi:putative hydrolase